MRIFLSVSGTPGVVSRIHLSPMMLLAGCCFLSVAVVLTWRLARRATRDIEGGELSIEIRLIGLMVGILAAVTLISASLFDYR